MCFRMAIDVVLKVSYSFRYVQISCGSLKSHVQRIYIVSDSKLFLVDYFLIISGK